MSCSKLPLPEIGDKAQQPLNFSFWEIIKPSGSKGGHGYITMLIVIKLSAFRAHKNNYLPSASSLEKSFISTGFNCWKEVYKVLNLRIHRQDLGQNLSDSYYFLVANPPHDRSLAKQIKVSGGWPFELYTCMRVLQHYYNLAWRTRLHEFLCVQIHSLTNAFNYQATSALSAKSMHRHRPSSTFNGPALQRLHHYTSCKWFHVFLTVRMRRAYNAGGAYIWRNRWRK